MAYLITYDLVTPGKDYSSLYQGIQSLGPWCHCLDSVWIVINTSSAAEIRDYLRGYVDRNDKILVVELTGHWAAWNLQRECAEWLKSNL